MYTALLLGFFIYMTPVKESVKAVFSTKTAELTLFSEAPMENIEAVSKSAYGVLNTDNGEIQFGVSIKSFRFRKSLMQEHFNENYMESDRYPAAKFKGKLNTPIDVTKDGEYEVTAIGDLEVHGVTKRRSITGTIKVLDGRLEIKSAFDVKCKDHNIKIPALVFKNIAETIRITLKGTFSTIT
ncbi:YceI family protein [Daejeonella lutea]|uniref:YceI-like domain-containing protein n=1 Tax=Daejeonella lutea TaxID=572036 RepID=A0A1T5ARP2_9SPHI|nr:YceI family protein [Daejeonella lutea]SKB37652.1 YceI-like domain-containing protein [Daejeonella lutea]